MSQLPSILLVGSRLPRVLYELSFPPNNYDLRIARTGAQALWELKKQVSVVCLDDMLPDITGLEVERKLRSEKTYAINKSVPLIIIYASDKRQKPTEGYPFHIPHDQEQLRGHIDNILQTRS